MRYLMYVLLVFAGCNQLMASINFSSNPNLPYPPACATDQEAQRVAFLHDTDFTVTDLVTREPVTLSLSAYRSGCSEPGRSLIWLRFSVPAGKAEPFVAELPVMVAETAPGVRYLMNLVNEPNGWGANTEPTSNRIHLAYEPDRYLPGDADPSWLFLLDNAETTIPASQWSLTAEQYNSSFQLVFRYPPYDMGFSLAIPSTQSLNLPAPALTLSGRLSGNWVIDGAADQGLVIAISSRVDPNDPLGHKRHSPGLVIFLAHYTYDANGDLLWLTGAASFEPGATTVTIPIERVSNGQFLGETEAHREVIGSVRLSAQTCNDLLFEFDYDGVGLGSGSDRLQRLYSLETAGYDCRDYAARVSANQ